MWAYFSTGSGGKVGVGVGGRGGNGPEVGAGDFRKICRLSEIIKIN